MPVFNFDSSPWYTDVQNLFLDFNGARAIQVEDGKLIPNTSLADVEFELGTDLTRTQSIVFLDALIEQGYLDIDDKYIGEGFSFDYPAASIREVSEDGVNIITSNGYRARIGIQRIAAGLYTSLQDPIAVTVLAPKNLQGEIARVRRFESCDQLTLNCQVAYFFVVADEGPTYFLEVSYEQARYATAKKVIEYIYQSFDLQGANS